LVAQQQDASMIEHDEATARERGRAAGQNTSTFAGQCPYPHSEMELRTAWMDGFGDGREKVVEQAGELQVAKTAKSEAEDFRR
jgi:ribosome modulation factor